MNADPGIRQRALADTAMPAGALAAFAIASMTAPFGARTVDEVVLGLLALVVVAVALVAGRARGAFAAVMAAFSFDFFHVEPIRVLHPRSLASSLVFLVLVAALCGRDAAVER